ncbi:MAG: MBL fold metallo-hydrolase [Clostridiales bacterium]|jgi:L-ascorbate metabolism protein UlaG (beta-lactamase superfamily)|nr:MBL fold metallo-hydrolase [Clostridiales bacterium]
MLIHWFAHSAFLLTARNGLSILTDPFDAAIGYTLENVVADVVTISHDHHDHNHLASAAGAPQVLRTEGEWKINGAGIYSIPSFHDEKGGAERGANLIFLFEMDDVRVCHLGDQGCMPSEEAFQKLGNVDVLLAPVGGIYTIGPREVCDIANRTNTAVLIPMHFQTPRLRLGKPILGVEPLLSVVRSCNIHRLNQSECCITKETLGHDRLLVLDPSL